MAYLEKNASNFELIKVKIDSKGKSTFRAKALRRELVVTTNSLRRELVVTINSLRRELVVTTNSRRRAFARNVDFPLSFQVAREPLPFAYH